jgi:DNA polymerase-3 subunit alpha
MEAGQRIQRDRLEGQASFFDLMPAPPPAPKTAAAAPAVPEWDDDQRLAFEKEVLGFYISGHPLARYASVVEPLGISTTGALASHGPGARVRLFGLVMALKETVTKSGNRMAFLTLEDIEGTVEVTVFPEPFKSAAPALRSGQPVLVRGRIDDSDKGRVVLAEDVRLLETALGESAARGGNGGGNGVPGACRLRVLAGDGIEETLAALRRVCAEHAGSVPLFVHLLLPGTEVVVRARPFAVDASPAFVAKVQALLGDHALVLEHAGRA